MPTPNYAFEKRQKELAKKKKKEEKLQRKSMQNDRSGEEAPARPDDAENTPE